jgi:glycosyltransferase involved in cell wall biosynthesis
MQSREALEAIIAFSHRHKASKAEYLSLLAKLRHFPRYLYGQLQADVSLPQGTRPPGLSAVLRLRNEAEFVKASILSIYDSVSEIICVLNNPEDGTENIVCDLAKSLKKISIHYYPTAVEQPYVSNNYFERVMRNPDGSLARYYNFSFALASYSHVVKWDGDMIATDRCRSLFSVATSHDVVFFDGMDLLGQRTTVPEPRIYRVGTNRYYVDTTNCEQLFLENSSPALFPEPVYLHMKLGKGEKYRDYIA